MKSRIRAVLIGDAIDAPWHPLEQAQSELEAILGNYFELETTENYERFATLDPSEVPLCISYTDCWNRLLSLDETAGLLRYTAGGGGLLVIHNGISVAGRYELLQLIGAAFTEHPPFQTLTYHGSDPEHPILQGVDSFTLDEEPYFFDFDSHTPRRVFLEYEFEGKRYPAAWEHTYGLGRVVYLQPGHHRPSFHPLPYRKLILNAARWASSARES